MKMLDTTLVQIINYYGFISSRVKINNMQTVTVTFLISSLKNKSADVMYNM